MTTVPHTPAWLHSRGSGLRGFVEGNAAWLAERLHDTRSTTPRPVERVTSG
jgi:hypothetical protein